MSGYDDFNPNNMTGGNSTQDNGLPPGKYKARAIDGALGESGEKKTPCVDVMFRIEEGDHAGEEIGWQGWMTDKAVKTTFRALRNMGWQGDNVTELVGIDQNIVELDVQRETYEGKTRTKVKWVNRPGGFRASPLATDQAKAIAAKFKGYAIESRKEAAKSGPAAHEKEAPARTPEQIKAAMGISDDDIAF